MGFFTKKVWIIVGILSLVYFSLFAFSFGGYGYAGHRGYNRGPSFFYFGGAHHYPGPSVRGGSMGGPGQMGGGIRGGK